MTEATTMNTTDIQSPDSAFNKLVRRMLSFAGNFDGYPTTSCTDEELIFTAHQQAAENGSGLDTLGMLMGIACAFATTPEQIASCKGFIKGYVDACFDCTMSEGGNIAYDELQQH